jgi:hypothetical protein
METESRARLQQNPGVGRRRWEFKFDLLPYYILYFNDILVYLSQLLFMKFPQNFYRIYLVSLSGFFRGLLSGFFRGLSHLG